MSGATEIYICQPGQAIKEGRVEYGTMESRNEAASDAVRRCKSDPSIAKIAYYAVKEDGAFRSIYSYENPNAAKAPSARKKAGGVGTVAGARRAPAQGKRSFMDKIRGMFAD